jgi:UTP--glucose-1-phosphate uridylyltransferase
MSPRPLKTAVFPVGGLGTRFLPVTKTIPKEMLPIIDKPLIQYAFEEAVEAGFEQFIFVAGRNKTALYNHFDRAYELERTLDDREKKSLLSIASGWLPAAGNIAFIRQVEPLGLGHAVWCARHFVGNEPFAVILADVLLANQGLLKSMVASYRKTGANIIAINEIPREQTGSYGIVEFGKDRKDLHQVVGMVEKPHPKHAPSTHAILGRYILNPEIFDLLQQTKKGAGGEIQLTDGMKALLKTQPFYGLDYKDDFFDCGSKEGFLEATLAFSLARPELAPLVRNLIKKYRAS